MTAAKVRSVLIVEDEGIVARDLQQTLVDLGYDAFAIAASANDAIARATERCPDIVLMDIRIKGDRDGIETARLLKGRFGVPVVFLTAHADASTLDRAKRTEPHGYLLKPVRSADLQSALEMSLYKHEMEQRLRERERWLATTLRAIGDAVISTDAAGNVTYLNPIAELLTGWTNEDARGRPLADVLQLISEARRTPIEQPISAALREGRVVERLEDLLLVARSGTERPIADSAAPIVDDGAVIGAVMVFRDVTEQRRIQKQLEFADRLASLGTMAAGVAHEVNNPLAVVVSNVDFVMGELDELRNRARAKDEADAGSLARPLGAIDEALADTKLAAQRIKEIVADLALFSKPPSLPGGSADVRRVVQWAVQATSGELRHRANVVVDLGDVPPADVAENRLVQVLVNLLINAAHAIAPGPSEERNEVRVTSRTLTTGRIQIEVSDTGCGIPEAILPRVFDPFFTTKGPASGTGLGLAVCHGIVTSAGGQISVQSRAGEGTTFTIVIPAAPDRGSAPPPPAPRGSSKRGRVLLVDDEPMLLHALRRMLSKLHDVVTASSPAQAAQLLEAGEPFDAIVLDVMMPVMTGVDLYSWLLERNPNQARAVVFLSGGATSTKTAEFLESVPNRTLLKPVSALELQDVVGALVDGA